MSYILNIETATTVCSVAISQNEKILFHKELNEGFTHAENLHLFIQEGLKELNISPQQLSAVGVSRGPGSYTGLRIGVSTAKGLAYALNIPLMSVDTLQIMAFAAQTQNKDAAFYCPMIDARRMEVYTGVYNEKLEQIKSVRALVVDEESLEEFRSYNKIYFFGDGMPKCKSLLEKLKNSSFVDHINPSAEFMATFIYSKFLAQDFEDLAYFEPFYLKDFRVLKKKNLL